MRARRAVAAKFLTMLAVAALGALFAAGATQAQGIGLPTQANGKPISINADNGIEWDSKNKTYVAHGNARAAQGDVSVYADTLTAHYREGAGKTTQIWRIDADGHVRIVTPTQRAYGEKAVYDVDRGILVLTGDNLRLVTRTDRITARNSLEYWEKRSLAVARGDAIAQRGENRLRADILTAHFVKDKTGKSSMQRVDAYGNVVITTPHEVVRSKRGVYNVDTGVATLTGSVKITRGKNQLNGQRAVVNLNTGVSRLFGGGPGGVRGIFSPKDMPDIGAGKGQTSGKRAQ